MSLTDLRREVASFPDAALAVDRDNVLLCWNEAAEEMFDLGQRRGETVYLNEVLDARDGFGNRFCGRIQGVHRMIDLGETVRPFPLSIDGDHGPERLVFRAAPYGSGRNRGDQILIRLTPDRRRVVEQFRFAQYQRGLEESLGPDPREGLPEGDEEQMKKLTERQREVLLLLGAGHAPKDVAERLGVSTNTIRNHIQAILQRLGARNRTHALALAFRRRLL